MGNPRGIREFLMEGNTGVPRGVGEFLMEFLEEVVAFRLEHGNSVWNSCGSGGIPKGIRAVEFHSLGLDCR